MTSSLLWVWIAFLPPLCYGITNYLDQVVARRYFPKNPIIFGSFCSLSNLVFMLLFWAIYPEVLAVSSTEALGAMVAGVFFWLSLVPYAMALHKHEASVALPFYQLVPFFVMVLGWLFLEEVLAFKSVVAASIIVLGGLGMAWHYEAKRIYAMPVVLIGSSAVFFAAFVVVLRLYATTLTWYEATFWSLAGACAVSGVHVLVSARARRKIIDVLLVSKGKAFLWNLAQQTFDVLANASLALALSLAPSAAHVSSISGTLPTFLLILGLILHPFLPQYIQKIPCDRTFFYRLFSAAFVGLGVVLLI